MQAKVMNIFWTVLVISVLSADGGKIVAKFDVSLRDQRKSLFDKKRNLNRKQSSVNSTTRHSTCRRSTTPVETGESFSAAPPIPDSFHISL